MKGITNLITIELNQSNNTSTRTKEESLAQSNVSVLLLN